MILETGKCMDQFPSDVFQGGAGTSVKSIRVHQPQ
ncbi:aspartate ammonia-lyase [Vibrio cholerae]|nr:aspartate ammonia-lyase [Vibrio cholerae]